MLKVWTAIAAFALLAAVFVSTAVQGASKYADPQFQTQWQQGEAITPNFWGPLSTAKEGQQEPYKESQGGQRLVQYFDKGRMELTNGKVTNGLLATEIIKAQIQVGDATFQPKDPPAIPIAGDPDNPGPTYAGLASKGKTLFDATTQYASKDKTTGALVATKVAADGTVTPANPQTGTGPTAMIAFDTQTKHNVPKAFADYRDKAGLATIGLAISEPFLTTVKVAGQQKDVMVQVFERRVLTYTASNPAAFQVEMGNIGQHYYQWRYASGASANTPAATAATTATTAPASSPAAAAPSATSQIAGAKAPPTPPATSGSATIDVKISGVLPNVKKGDIQTVNVATVNTAKTGCSLDVTYPGNKPVDAQKNRLQPQFVDGNGNVLWAWTIGDDATAGTATIVVNCTINNSLGTANASFTIG
jgi:hypothetical protein